VTGGMLPLLREAGSLFLREAWRMLPAFLLGVGVAAFIKTFRWDLRLRSRMIALGGMGIPFAVFLGIVSPLCACGVLPVVIPMALSGIPLSIVLAFLVTSPLMSPDSFIITWQGLGPGFAWTKLASAAGMGFLVGGVTHFLEKRSNFTNDIVRLKPVRNADGTLAPAWVIANANDFTVPTMTVKARENRWLFFLDRAWDMARVLGKYLLLALVLQVLMELWLPLDAVRFLAGSSGWSSLLLAALVGVPLPAHQVAVVPIVKGLLDLGMDRGAAVTFMVAGPVTSIPALLVLWKVFQPRLFFLYLGLCLGGAVTAGAAYRLAGWLFT
jgi:uncharacterized membrane protein YraQ (UPF0718 family)